MDIFGYSKAKTNKDLQLLWHVKHHNYEEYMLGLGSFLR